MTGYGRADGDTSFGHLLVEIKSVNHRFLDTRIRLPKQLSSIEPHLLNFLKNAIARGRVEISLNLTSSGENAVEPVFNPTLAKLYYQAASKAAEELSLNNTIGLEFILRLPDVLQTSEASGDPEDMWREIQGIVEQAVKSLGAMRGREGVSLAEDFRKTLAEIEEKRLKLVSLKELVVEEYRDKLQTRLKSLLSENGGLDPARLHQEVALFADRSDVSEELARLESHLKQYNSIISLPEPVGRRLDFLLQEMFREINTIGSKANHLEVTQLVIEMKNLVERLREQAQNVE